jgi:hypothetical protein
VELESKKHHIIVSHPEKYELGQKVKVKVKSNNDDDAWDLNRLNFEIEVIK